MIEIITLIVSSCIVCGFYMYHVCFNNKNNENDMASHRDGYLNNKIINDGFPF